MPDADSIFWERVKKIDGAVLESIGLTREELFRLSDSFSFEPVGLYISDLDIGTYEVRQWTPATAVREFIQNAMDAECGPKLMCRPRIQRDGMYVVIANRGEPFGPEFLIYGYSSKREQNLKLYRGQFGEGAKGAMAALAARGLLTVIYTAYDDMAIVPVIYRGTIGAKSVNLLSYIIGKSTTARRMGYSVVVKVEDPDGTLYSKAKGLVFSYWLDMLRERGVDYQIVPLHEELPESVAKIYAGIEYNTEQFESYLVLLDTDDYRYNRVYVKDIYVGDEDRADVLDGGWYRDLAFSYNLWYSQLEPNRRRLSSDSVVTNTAVASFTIYDAVKHLVKRMKVVREMTYYIFTADKYYEELRTFNASSVIIDAVKETGLVEKHIVNAVSSALNVDPSEFTYVLSSGATLTSVVVAGVDDQYSVMSLLSNLGVTKGAVVVSDLLARLVSKLSGSMLFKISAKLSTVDSVLTTYPYASVAKVLEEVARLVVPTKDVSVSVAVMAPEVYGMAVRITPTVYSVLINKDRVDDIVKCISNSLFIDDRIISTCIRQSRLLGTFVHELAHVSIGEAETRAHGEKFSQALEHVFENLMMYYADIATSVVYALYGHQMFTERSHIQDALMNYIYSYLPQAEWDREKRNCIESSLLDVVKSMYISPYVIIPLGRGCYTEIPKLSEVMRMILAGTQRPALIAERLAEAHLQYSKSVAVLYFDVDKKVKEVYRTA
ncbi:MAG: hypothetical protein ACPL4I_10970 [Bacteroidota bacterium]